MSDAKVTVGADVSAVQAAAEAVKKNFKSLGADIASSIGNAAKSVVTDLGNVVTAAGHVNFGAQAQSVRDFEASSARMAVAMGRDLEGLRGQIETIGTAIGRRPRDVAAWANSVAQLTYNFESALEAEQGLAQLAAQTGRSVESYQALAVQLGQMGVQGKQAADVIATISAQAREMKTAGGVAALTDQFASLGDMVTQFSTRGAEGITQLTALVAELGKGLDAASAKRVGQQALGALTSDPRGWERLVGHKILDDQGHVQNPAQVYKEIYEKAKSRYGSGDTLRNVMINTFGAETGMAVLNAGKTGRFDQAAALAHVEPAKNAGAALAAYQGMDAGKREAAAVELDKSSKALLGSSTLLGKAADALQNFAASHPIAGTMASGVTGGAVAAGAGLAGAALKGGATRALGVGAGVLGKAIPVVGAAMVGGAAGAALGGYLSDKYEEHYGEPESKAQLAAMDAKTAEMKRKRDAVRAAKGLPPLGGAPAPALATAEETGAAAGGKQLDPNEIKRAVEDGLKKGVKVQIYNMSDSVIEAAAEGQAASHAGGQGG